MKEWFEVVDKMLRQQPVTVGNVDEIAAQVEKQEVRIIELYTVLSIEHPTPACILHCQWLSKRESLRCST